MMARFYVARGKRKPDDLDAAAEKARQRRIDALPKDHPKRVGRRFGIQHRGMHGEKPWPLPEA